MFSVLLFLVILSVLVLAHEAGHYVAARIAKVKVEEFGLGFPPRIFSWKNKNGMTWSLNAIPLGGFVKLKGESGDERAAHDSFARQSLAKRFFVLVAGVGMNLVTAAVIFGVGFVIGMPTIVDGGIAGGTVSNQDIRVIEVLPDSPASQAGILVGDKLVGIDGVAYTSSTAARDALSLSAPHTVTFARGDVEVVATLDPTFIPSLNRAVVGLGLVETGTVRFPWYAAPFMGIRAAASSTWQVLSAFGVLLASPFTHANIGAEVSGPIGIAVLTGEVAKLGIAHVLQFAAMLSINLAIINILPIPALDGGRVAFLALEAIRRKPTTPRVEQMVHAAGFAVLLLLIVVVTLKDIVGLFS